jgi:hypothetical protein
MKRNILILTFLCVLAVPSIARAQYFQGATFTGIAHSWASQRIDGEIWGLSYGDVNGDGTKEIVILKRDMVVAGTLAQDGFKPTAQYKLKGFLNGVRIFTMDLDGDAAEEIVVSAIENGHPSSFAIKYSNGGFEPVFADAPWHVRVISSGGSKKLVGQQWNGASFFFGPIYDLQLKSGKLDSVGILKLASTTDIFDFDIISIVSDDITKETYVQDFAWLEGYNPLKIYERRKKRYKKIWSSGVKFGGTINLVEATQREALGQAMDYYIQIDREPEVVSMNGHDVVIAAQHDIPLKNMIGRKPYIRSGKLVAFKKDDALGFSRYFETEEVPGFISDFFVYETETVQKTEAAKSKKGARQVVVLQTKLIMVVQPDTSAFRADRDSVLLSFDLPQ